MALATKPTTATLFGSSSLDYLFGTVGDDTITGGASATILTTPDASSTDLMEGSAGDDVYIVNATGVVITEIANEGIDTVYTTVTYTLPSEVENGVSNAASAITLTGNAKDNKLDGSQNVAVADVLVGGLGNDIYYLGTGDTVTEASNAGTDTIISASTINLTTNGSNVENAILTAAGTITGNTLANKLTGSSGIDTISGGTGNDTIDGGAETSAAIDSLIGGAGDDTYIIRNILDGIDETVAGSAGSDTVKATITGYTLATNVEKLILMGNVVAGTGNSGNNTLTGNSAANTLTGGAGNDTLDGGTGADTMIGGTGNDTYIVDNAGDTITEDTGTDVVQSSVTLSISADIESIILTGTTAINATTTSTVNTTIAGNTANNSLTGGDGNDNIMGNAGNDTLNGGNGTDTLNGGTGVDIMNGGAGDDTYIIDSLSEATITDASGTDTIQSSVSITSLDTDIEKITLTGSGGLDATGNVSANTITGNTGGNSLVGGEGDDTITGGKGADSLTGGADNDTFVLATTTADADSISDFGTGTDILDFNAYTTTLVDTYEEVATVAGDITTNATVILFGGSPTIDAAATAIAADVTVTGTKGVILFSDGTHSYAYGTTNLAGNGTETLLVTLVGVNDSELLAFADANFSV